MKLVIYKSPFSHAKTKNYNIDPSGRSFDTFESLSDNEEFCLWQTKNDSVNKILIKLAKHTFDLLLKDGD